MKSDTHGNNTSAIEVSNISPHGFWLLVDAGELFLPFEQYPWFRNATVAQIANVQLLHESHLYWPDIDVDLSLSILKHPAQYPLMAQAKNLDAVASCP